MTERNIRKYSSRHPGLTTSEFLHHFYATGIGVTSEMGTYADIDNIEGLATGDHSNPFSVLGMHGGDRSSTASNKAPLVVRSFMPGATEVAVIDSKSGSLVANLEPLHASGIFAGCMGRRRKHFPYRLRVNYGAHQVEVEDPYRFPPSLDNAAIEELASGNNIRTWQYLGAHPTEMEDIPGWRFAVWAPNAKRVSVVGDFNGWDGRRHIMRLHHRAGLWEIFIPGLQDDAIYKYEVLTQHGEQLLKSDPFAFAAEVPPRTGSRLCRREALDLQDSDWLTERARRNAHDAPISIYEVHLGSWKRVDSDTASQYNNYLSYRQLADQLVPYVKDLGFTHLQLLPIAEYPFDGSWGYQPVSLFAPSGRFGGAADFKYFVEACHREKLGLLLDWVPGHFPNDAHGLHRFDGTHLYEHEDKRLGYHPDWNTHIYNYGRTEVRNFLVSNALFWLEQYHLDGLRMDAVASMLYLDYSRNPGEWLPNHYGGNTNLEAVEMIKAVNETLYREVEGIMTVAEESTAWPGVSRPTYLDGLGFGYKWNMGWMHDTLQYMQRDPVHRRYHHNEMTFGLTYAYSENFVLPLSHDEVVHGKGSLLSRMPGDGWQQFANLRAYFGFMWTHPGKKLLFMGGEFAQGREWNHDSGLDWHQLEIAEHRGVQNLVRDLNTLYRQLPALHQQDCHAEGFRWIKHDDTDHSVYAFVRRGREENAPVLACCNFTPAPRFSYRIGVPLPGFYRERLNTDATLYGGSNLGNNGGVDAQPVPWDGQPYSVEITLPPLATVIFSRDP